MAKPSVLKLHQEAEPYCRVEFMRERASGTTTLHTADCALDIAISGLKQDLADLLDAPAAQQRWFYNNTLLEDHNDLNFYGIQEQRTRNYKATIKVKVVSP